MPSHERPFLALGLRLAAMVMLSLMLVLVKLTGERGMPLPETMFWRQTLPAVMLLGWLGARGELRRLRTARPWVHFRRAMIGTAGMFLTLGVVQILPLAEATVLGFTAPVFAVILSALVLKEKVGPWRWLAVAIGLLGILVIAGPSEGKLPALGVAVGVGAAFMVALVSIQLRDLGRTEEPLTVVFYFSAMSAPLLALFLFHTGVHHDALGWLMLGGIGVLGLAAQLLMTAALRFGRVSSVIVMDYSQFGWATLWGWIVFDHLPPATTWIGAPIVIAAGLIIAWREHVLARTRATGPVIA
ncbi:DMT family transporter [Novosphingobium pokkalii]|uniref:DMT family transporter n=1 Tax=Novosphingobium pokkalii TaxID=1770194 RepID=A0ABV7V0V4_9SPHN|nr:DMT family transporter [Novosphingobium pokkalii]GHC82141.1 membrane protein [Novosphingobium pokkalii]